MKNKKKALIATHGDLDGVVAAVILSSKLSPEYDIEIKFVIYSMLKEIFEAISRKDLRETEVFVLDLSLNDCLISGGQESIMGRIARKAKIVTYIDHHEGTKIHREALKDLYINVRDGYDEKECASGLVYDLYFLFSPDQYFSWLSSIAQTSDYNPDSPGEIGRIGRDLNSIILLYLFKSDLKALDYLVDTLSRGKWYNDGKYSDGIRAALTEAQPYQRKALAVLEKSIEVVEIGGKKIMLGFGQGVLPDKDTIVRLRRQKEEAGEEADCYIVSFGMPINNTLVLARKDDFPVINFCTAVGGGGRPYGDDSHAGGFSFAFNVTDESYKKAKEIIITGLKKFWFKV